MAGSRGLIGRVPFTFLAHQAPVVPLKLWRPRWFSGAALAIGSMAPDFDKFVRGDMSGRFGHTLVGQVAFCLPWSLAVYWLLTRVVAGPLALYVPNLGRLHCRDYAVALAHGRRPGWATVAASALVGSVSHVAFDGFTHGDPRVVALLPMLAPRIVAIGDRQFFLFSVLQVAGSALGALVTLAFMYQIGRSRRVLSWAALPVGSTEQVAVRARGALRYWMLVGGATAALSAGLAVGTSFVNGGWASKRALAFSVGLRLPAAGFAALCLGGVVLRRHSSHHTTTHAPSARPSPPSHSRAT